MSEFAAIQIDPEHELVAPVYATLGEGSTHVDTFTDQPGFEWRTWCQDKDRMIPLIRGPLLQYWAELNALRQGDLKYALQYLLNVDETVPYEMSKVFPELKSKKKGVGERYFGAFQDTIQPYDNYALCQWFWEILFGDEAWATDVSSWRLVEKLGDLQGNPRN